MPQVRAPRCANQKARRRHIYSTPAALRKCATAPPLMAREQDETRETRHRRSALARHLLLRLATLGALFAFAGLKLLTSRS
jgi:hypothetical protein